MTIIVALKVPGRAETWIGSDTRSVANYEAWRVGPKWVRAHGWAFGTAGSHRLHDMVTHNTERLFADVATPFEFTERLREVLGMHGYKFAERPGFPTLDGDSGLLVSAHGVWEVDCSLATVRIPDGHVAADGGGKAYALGAVWGMTQFGGSMLPDRIVSNAIECACHHNLGCGGDIFVDKITANEP